MKKYEIGGDIKTVEFIILEKIFAELFFTEFEVTVDHFIVFTNSFGDYLFRSYVNNKTEEEVVKLAQEMEQVFLLHDLKYVIEVEEYLGEMIFRTSNW